MNNLTRLGLIGAGRWGPNLIGALKRITGVEVQHVADTNESALDSLSQRFPGLFIHHNPSELISLEKLDAVVIATPVKTHFELTREALSAGKHVFVEKPFGQDPQVCNELNNFAARNNLQIMVGHVFLFNASIIAMKKIIDAGELGNIMHLEAHRTNLGPVRKDVNAVCDLTSHDLSIFDYLLDDLPVGVSSIGSSKLDSNVADTTFTTFRYKQSTLAHAHASWLNPRKLRQITVIGDKKMALWDDLNLEHPITIFDSSIGLDQSYYSDSFASHRLSYNRGPVVMPAISTNEPLLEEMRHFIDVVRGESKNRCSGNYGKEVAISLQAADQSRKENGKFIVIQR